MRNVFLTFSFLLLFYVFLGRMVSGEKCSKITSEGTQNGQQRRQSDEVVDVSASTLIHMQMYAAIYGGGDSVRADGVSHGPHSSGRAHGASYKVFAFHEFDEYVNVVLRFLARTFRILLEVLRDGHCGILCLMRPEHPLNGAPSHNQLIYEGRTRMANALRNHGAAMTEIPECGLSTDDLEARIQMHDEVKSAFDGCQQPFWVDSLVDLMAWSVATGKKIGLVRQFHMGVTVYSGYAIPTSVSLDEYAPEPEDLVLYHVNGSHYQSLFYHRAEPVITTDNIIDEIFEVRSQRFPMSDDCEKVLLPRVNTVRTQRGQPPLEMPALQKAIAIWRQTHPGYEIITTDTFVTEFVTLNGHIPSMDDCKTQLLPHVNLIRKQRGLDDISFGGLRKALSRWRQKHPECEPVEAGGSSSDGDMCGTLQEEFTTGNFCVNIFWVYYESVRVSA